MYKYPLIIALSILVSTSVLAQETPPPMKIKKVMKTTEQWKKTLSAEAFYILREKGTDQPGEGGYTAHFEKGTYHCTGCKLQLFESDRKFRAHCGWPSFDEAIPGTVLYVPDHSHGMIRTEIICAACEGHLGHVFDDGPIETTGKRYCVNSTSITLIPEKE